jgi:hypothetical protein
MAKRKREIQKRKKQQDPGTEYLEESVGAETVPDESAHRDASQTRKSVPAGKKPPMASKSLIRDTTGTDPKTAARDTRLSPNKENLLLGLLVLYVVLLGLGTVGELFEIEWILNLPLFK